MFVSHDMDSIERFCNRAMLIEQGKMTEIGDPREVGRALPPAQLWPVLHAHDAPDESHSSLKARPHRRRLVRERAGRAHHGAQASERPALCMCFEARIAEAIENPVFAVHPTHRLSATRSSSRAPTSTVNSSGSFNAGMR